MRGLRQAATKGQDTSLSTIWHVANASRQGVEVFLRLGSERVAHEKSSDDWNLWSEAYGLYLSPAAS
jgi:hypothetical protein